MLIRFRTCDSTRFRKIGYDLLLTLLPRFRRCTILRRVVLHGVVVNDLARSEEHTSELQSLTNLVCRLLLEKKKTHDLTPVTVEYRMAASPCDRENDLLLGHLAREPAKRTFALAYVPHLFSKCPVASSSRAI